MSRRPAAAAEQAAIWGGVAVAVLAAVHAIAGWWGRDFGLHWDEWKLQVVLTTPDGVALLPHWYQYPSLCFDLSLLALLPEVLSGLDGAALHEAAQSHDQLLRMRTLFIGLVASTPIWVYALARSLGRPVFEAVVAGALVAGSWELSYHGRWVAPDGLMMMLATATLVLCLQCLRRGGDRRWLAAAAVAAGLTTSAKYPGGILVIPLLGVALASTPDADEAGARAWRRLLWAGGFFVLGFLAATPGALLEPDRFVAGIADELQHYGEEGHLGHDQAPGIGHLASMLEYLATQLFSPEPWVSGLVFAGALFGIWCLLRTGSREVWIVFAVPVLYLAYFASQRVMIVRNLLVLAPFLALGAGVAAGWVRNALRSRLAAQRAWAAVCAALVAFQLATVVSAAATVGRTDASALVERLRAHLAAHPAERFALAPPLLRALSASGALPPNAVPLASAAVSLAERDVQHVAIWSSALLPRDDRWPPWPANERGRYTVFGPRDVNFDYYPNWLKPDRIVVMDPPVFESLRSWRRGSPRPPPPTPEPG